MHVAFYHCAFKEQMVASKGKWLVLGHRLPPLWLPRPCNIRGACLGKYRGLKVEKIGNGLTSMILDGECFGIFFIRIWGVKMT